MEKSKNDQRIKLLRRNMEFYENSLNHDDILNSFKRINEILIDKLSQDRMADEDYEIITSLEDQIFQRLIDNYSIEKQDFTFKSLNEVKQIAKYLKEMEERIIRSRNKKRRSDL